MRIERAPQTVTLSGKVVAVDFDGVLTDKGGWGPPGELLPRTADLLHRLRLGGYHVAILTARPVDEVVAWLETRGLHKDVALVTNRKMVADAYIDDRAVRFDPRMSTLQLIQAVEQRPWWKNDVDEAKA